MYVLNDNVKYIPDEELVESDIAVIKYWCTAAPHNVIDFSSVPIKRIFQYRMNCYDVKNTIIFLNDNWHKSDFRFTIDDKHYSSFQTMMNLAVQATSYNLGITKGLGGRPEYTCYIRDAIHAGELIETGNFMELLILIYVTRNPLYYVKK